MLYRSGDYTRGCVKFSAREVLVKTFLEEFEKVFFALSKMTKTRSGREIADRSVFIGLSDDMVYVAYQFSAGVPAVKWETLSTGGTSRPITIEQFRTYVSKSQGLEDPLVFRFPYLFVEDEKRRPERAATLAEHIVKGEDARLADEASH